MTDIIMYHDADVKYVKNIKGWVSRDRFFYGDNKDSEHLARYESCTHKLCKCGEIMERYYTACGACRELKRIQRYNDKPFKEYNAGPLYSEYYD